ncbi:MAG: UDP-N-acetyl-D-mannosamine dehydrogenase [Candidatus Riflebacteria bacterium]|nr:UDP-N-acetyl-D-mannosamine dehydrogenase [Candidatus Riflebacteria bacterium]
MENTSLNRAFSKICIIGLGYIGLPTGSILANRGYDVIGVDVQPEIVRTINEGRIHIVEPDLDILVRAGVNSGKLKASLKPEKAEVFIICVPTPFKEGHKPDMSYVEDSTHAIVPYLEKGNLVILESTSPAGTCEKIIRPIIEKAGWKVDEEILVAHCPERVLPGQILKECIENDRVIGGISPKSALRAKELYSTFVNGQIFLTDCTTAEMAKLTENSFRDVNIAFANELANICDRMGINVWELITLANRHPRVKILNPGPGVGGHCIAVDPWFIVDSCPEEAKLIRTAREVNDDRPNRVIQRIQKAAEKFKKPTIGMLGLAFKANIDDLRESPAVKITRSVLSMNLGEVLICEPNVKSSKEFQLHQLGDIINKADILVVLVDHQQFKQLDKSLLNEKVIIDTRGIW